MKRFIYSVISLSILLGSSAAFADEEKTTTLSFEDDQIEGDLLMPAQTNVDVKAQGDLPELVKAREDHVDGMRKSVDNL